MNIITIPAGGYPALSRGRRDIRDTDHRIGGGPINFLQDGAEAARQAHNLKVVGSSPTPATTFGARPFRWATSNGSGLAACDDRARRFSSRGDVEGHAANDGRPASSARAEIRSPRVAHECAPPMPGEGARLIAHGRRLQGSGCPLAGIKPGPRDSVKSIFGSLVRERTFLADTRRLAHRVQASRSIERIRRRACQDSHPRGEVGPPVTLGCRAAEAFTITGRAA